MLQKVPQNTFAYRVSTLLRSLVHLVWMLQLPQVLILLPLLLTPEIVLNHQPQFATSVALASGAAVAASAASTPSLNHKSIEKTLILDLSAFKDQGEVLSTVLLPLAILGIYGYLPSDLDAWPFRYLEFKSLLVRAHIGDWEYKIG
nr:uncharacterized protein LOC113712809 isoform X2 [Coffea arabica]XP_027092196.1 uncharacterized protein LOC113712809 isoform X2 [Coffea arabica]